MNDILLYVLALAAHRHGVLVHAFCALSNHVHLVVTDPHGRLPTFMQYLDSLVARAVNASLGRFEGFWASDGSYSAVEPIDPQDVLAKIAYVLANPVAAGLVRRGHEWPGLWTSPEQIGTARLTARKPKLFFDPRGYLPDAVELDVSLPPAFASTLDFRLNLSSAVRDLEARHQTEIVAAGRKFLGVARVLGQRPFRRPPPNERRFELNPRLAARDKWRRIEGLARVKTFVHEYRQAWAQRRTGRGGVIFPAGTYLLRVLHGVHCAAAGSS